MVGNRNIKTDIRMFGAPGANTCVFSPFETLRTQHLFIAPVYLLNKLFGSEKHEAERDPGKIFEDWILFETTIGEPGIKIILWVSIVFCSSSN